MPSPELKSVDIGMEVSYADVTRGAKSLSRAQVSSVRIHAHPAPIRAVTGGTNPDATPLRYSSLDSLYIRMALPVAMVRRENTVGDPRKQLLPPQSDDVAKISAIEVVSPRVEAIQLVETQGF